MRKFMPVFLTVLFLLAACGRSSPAQETQLPAAQSRPSVEAETPAIPPTSAETEAPAIPPAQIPADATLLPRTLPGHIASDVYVQLFDGVVAPGLRAQDAETVKRIIRVQTWGDSCDNLSDTRIEAEGIRYLYDTQSGILTSADDRTARLDEADRMQLNAILAAYLDGYDGEQGFYES